MHDGAHIPTPDSTPVTRLSWAQLGAVVGVVSVIGAGCIGALAFAQDVGQERAALTARVAANAKALEACEDELEELAHVPSQIEAIDARTHEIASDVREIRALVIQIAQE